MFCSSNDAGFTDTVAKVGLLSIADNLGDVVD